jgi:AcrR family transcriptional regulator
MTTATHQAAPDDAARRGLRRDAVENRQRLLMAARHMFAVHGIEAGVEEVAHEAGVGVGTLYRRFPTKDALIAELVRELLGEVIAIAERALTVPGGRGLERYLFEIGAAHEANRGCLSRLWSDETTVPLRARARALMAELLVDAQRHGTVRDDATLTDIDLLFWALRGILEASGAKPTAAWRRHIALTVAGLRPSAEKLSEPPLRALPRSPARA